MMDVGDEGEAEQRPHADPHLEPGVDPRGPAQPLGVSSTQRGADAQAEEEGGEHRRDREIADAEDPVEHAPPGRLVGEGGAARKK